MMRRLRKLLVVAAAVTAMTVSAVPAASAQEAPMAAEGLGGELTLVHGVPDLLVDITVKGKFFGSKTVVEDVAFDRCVARPGL